MRQRIAHALLLGLIAVIVAGALRAGWQSADGVDSRTQIEMIRGVADHGLPFMFNGHLAQFHELQARWNVRDGERLWGAYPPLLAYLSWPFFRVGGFAAVSQMIWLLLIPFVLGTYALANRFFRDPVVAVTTTYLVALSTPVAATAVNVSAFILAETLIVWTLYAALVCLESPQFSAYFALSVGLLAGLAMNSHLLMAPMCIGIVLVMMVPDDDPSRVRFHGAWTKHLEPWVPTRASLIRGAFVMAGIGVTLIPMALINHARFKTYNPITYGKCVWQSCAATGLDKQATGSMLRFALPSLIWLGASLVALRIYIKDRLALVVVGIVSFAVLVSSAALSEHTERLAKIAFAYVVDLTPLDIPEFDRPHDKIGLGFADFVSRSMLQATPLLALLPFTPLRTTRDRRIALLFAVPSALLLLLCVLRADEPTVYAIGFPFVFLRYTVPVLAPLMLLVVAAIRDLPWKKHHAFAIAAFVAVMCIACYGRTDTSLWRRLLLLYGTLLGAVFCVVALWRARRSATSDRLDLAANAAALAIALGMGCTLAVTLPALSGGRNLNDGRFDRVARVLPQRFAVVGFSPELDTPLGLRASRDIEYLDLYELDPKEGWTTFRSIIDVWTAEKRPIFALFPKHIDIASPWPEIEFRKIDAEEHVFSVEKR